MLEATEKLRQVFPEVLQKQIFMFAEEMTLDDLPLSASDWVESRIYFTGPFSGSLQLSLPKEIELEIAANFLGKDVDDPDLPKFSDDALKEILNVLCGHMLTALAGDEPVFDLSIPTVTPLTIEQYAGLSDIPETLCFDVEGRFAIVSMNLNKENPTLQVKS